MNICNQKLIDFILNISLVAECKVIYKSMRDAHRYRQKKIAGKSGDSGDEMHIDESSKDGGDSNDFLSFLTPTSSRFPRKTMVMGAATETMTTPESSQHSYNPLEEDRDTNPFNNDDDSSASVYSFVCILFNFLLDIHIQ